MKKILVLLLSVTMLGCGGKGMKSDFSKKENIKIVKTVELKERILDNIKSYNGELKPKMEMKIVTSTGGDVEEIYFKNGDRVRKGQVIVKLYNADVVADYYEAQGRFLKTESTFSTEKISFEKYEKLYKKEIISENDYLNVKNRYETAQGEMKIAEGNFIRAKEDFDNLDVVSKIDGVITDLYVKKYEKLKSGVNIVTVIDNSEMEVDVAITGKDIGNSKIGEKAEVFVEEIGEKREGVVETFNLNSDSDSKKYSIRLGIKNLDKRILKGMYAKISLKMGDIKGIFVPTKALMIKDLYSYIAVVRGDRVFIYRVTPKRTIGDMRLIEFLEYQEGDRIVVEGQYLLNNNDRVKES